MTQTGVIPTVSYFLVLLRPVPDASATEPPWQEHVHFIDEMVSHGAVLLGGDLDPPVAGARAAYLLHTSTRAEAEAWTGRDPLVRQGSYAPEVIEWSLVGIALNAIHPGPETAGMTAGSTDTSTERTDRRCPSQC
ncbi:YciI family protein [Occultella aeris]|nr:YciI family protein [Occultella aeris]